METSQDHRFSSFFVILCVGFLALPSLPSLAMTVEARSTPFLSSTKADNKKAQFRMNGVIIFLTGSNRFLCHWLVHGKYIIKLHSVYGMLLFRLLTLLIKSGFVTNTNPSNALITIKKYSFVTTIKAEFHSENLTNFYVEIK